VLESSLFIGVATLIGLVVGSFLNVVIHRLPRMMENEWRAQCEELEGKPPKATGRYNLLVPRSAVPGVRRFNPRA
jgi:leader peptidase (prepilin peptidase)/N-methyltransferase